MSDIAETIKRILSMDQVARRYGFDPGRAGFIHCPFHTGDRTPSLRIYAEPGRGFHCFGCDAGGSVIDFVMRLFNISFSQVIVRLNVDFGLGLSGGRPDPRALERLKKERAKEYWARELMEAEYLALAREFRRLWETRIQKAPSGPQEGLDPEFCRVAPEAGAAAIQARYAPDIQRQGWSLSMTFHIPGRTSTLPRLTNTYPESRIRSSRVQRRGAYLNMRNPWASDPSKQLSDNTRNL